MAGFFLQQFLLASSLMVSTGAGNGIAERTAQRSAIVQRSHRYVLRAAASLRNPDTRRATLDAIANRDTCVVSRVGVTDDRKAAILTVLARESLIESTDAAAMAGVFPPLVNESSRCPRLPQPFWSTPGGAQDGHHAFPGGLPVHVMANSIAARNYVEEYRRVYGRFDFDPDLIIGAPLWHDWAKSLVFQWNADGTEFSEYSFGGRADEKTGAHHLLSLAEMMARGLPPGLVLATASAHNAPTLGNQTRVVKWLRTAAILAGVDPVARGYLERDTSGAFLLPPLRVEYTIHTLSDADFIFTVPAMNEALIILEKLGPEMGFAGSEKARYNNEFRNPVLSQLTEERIFFLEASGGIERVRRAVREVLNSRSR